MLLSILSLFYAPISTDYHYTNHTFYKLITSQSHHSFLYLLLFICWSMILKYLLEVCYKLNLPEFHLKALGQFGLWANLFVFSMIHKLYLQFGLLIHCEGISMIARHEDISTEISQSETEPPPPLSGVSPTIMTTKKHW